MTVSFAAAATKASSIVVAIMAIFSWLFPMFGLAILVMFVIAECLERKQLLSFSSVVAALLLSSPLLLLLLSPLLWL